MTQKKRIMINKCTLIYSKEICTINILYILYSPYFYLGTEQELSGSRERPFPLPDLLPDSHSSSEDSTSSSSTAEDDPRLEEQAVERVAVQLRTIGDEMNSVFLQRVRIMFV